MGAMSNICYYFLFFVVFLLLFFVVVFFIVFFYSFLNFLPLPEYIFLKLQIITLIPTSAGEFLVPEDIVRPVVGVYWLYLFLKFTYLK